ncbi:MAG: hypothetical protein ACYSWO_25470 [Planctomycetota bacterium]
MAWIQERTRHTMTWLDCYGLYREAGVNQYMTQEALDGNSEFVLAAQADMEAGADAARAENVAATQYAGEVLMGIGGVVLAAASGTVAGAVVGALLLAVGAILSFFASMFYVECDKYHCTGFDRNTDTRKNTYSRHVKAMVGIQTEDKSSWDLQRDCSCRRSGHNCSFVRYMHDGLIIEGIDWDVVEADPATSGQVRGAIGMPRKDKDTTNHVCTEHWRLMLPNATPLNKRGKRIPRGGKNWPELYAGMRNDPKQPSKYAIDNNLIGRSISFTDYLIHDTRNATTYQLNKYKTEDAYKKAKEKGEIREYYRGQWNDKPNTYYYRSWRVQQILYWMTGRLFRYENILCRTMKCMEETLGYTTAVGDDSAFNQKRRRGSRWYASIVWMMRDIWKAGQQMVRQADTPEKGWTQFGQVLQDSGCNENTLNTLREMAAGKRYRKSETPWPFFPLMKEISFDQMRLILINLKPYFPYEYQKPPAGPQPQGEARSRMTINVPVLDPISFDRNMQPIPEKLSGAGPGLGTIMLGLGAAAVGTYALYKLLAPAEEV